MHRLAILAGAVVAGLVVGCTADRPTTSPETASARFDASPSTIVAPGGSIQAAIDAAGAGAVIKLRPGTYWESVTITTPGLTLLGLSGPGGAQAVLENPGGKANGISVLEGGDGVTVANLTVRGFERNGVFLNGVEGFTVRQVTAEDNGAYGIYPVRSRDGVIRHSRASGHADAGLYVGQSHDVRIEHNIAVGNVIGIEISNSVRITARHNDTYDNAVGILAVLLPPSPFRNFLEASDIRVTHNRVIDNNRVNFAPPGSFPSFVPSGSGLLVVGFDDSVVKHNIVEDNGWVGIGVGSTATWGLIAGIPIIGLDDPDADRVVVRHNRSLGNGLNQPPGFPIPGADLLWDGTGVGNCWWKNTYQTSVPPVLPPCP